MLATLVSPATALVVGCAALLGVVLVLLHYWWQRQGTLKMKARLSDPWVSNPSRLKDQVEDLDS